MTTIGDLMAAADTRKAVETSRNRCRSASVCLKRAPQRVAVVPGSGTPPLATHRALQRRFPTSHDNAETNGSPELSPVCWEDFPEIHASTQPAFTWSCLCTSATYRANRSVSQRREKDTSSSWWMTTSHPKPS